jgi:parallel beta-helix repeat protein
MIRARLAVLLVSTALSTAAHAAILPATPSTVWTVTNGAATGDTVQLGAGTYALDLWNIKKAGEVIVTPAPGVAPVVTEVNASGSSNLTFRGIAVTMPAGAQYGIQAWQVSHVNFDSMTVTGPSCTTISGVGVSFRNLAPGAAVTLTNSLITCVGAGVGLTDADGVTVDHNTLHDIQTDGIIGGGVSNSVISNNTEHDFHTAGGGHPDFIQFFNDGSTTPPYLTSNVTIANNLFYRGNGDLVQGIFIEDGDRFTIRDNVGYGTAYNGIALARTTNATITHNYLQSLAFTGPPPGQGEPDMGTWMMVRQQANNIAFTRNATPALIIGVSGEPQPTNVVPATPPGDSTITAPAAPGDLTQYNAWVAKTGAPAGPTGPAPPTPNPPACDCVALTTKVATLTAQNATLTATNTTLQGQVTTLTNALTLATKQLNASKSQASQAIQILATPLPTK